MECIVTDDARLAASADALLFEIGEHIHFPTWTRSLRVISVLPTSLLVVYKQCARDSLVILPEGPRTDLARLESRSSREWPVRL